ncbi:hypothetical protein CC80DRAFT_581391 [Byssothecium circinans]|uniref:Glucose-methanol-choline oxidoreductase C-terminal domain-containing protein n=1 Tax=Byssothecium circinans TaxID=147558 RepID=A0A6A5TF52_9PLEO|nr:hypothetical protein CC80DRAFT_581391 [Byssothecium circinans]
MLFAVRKAGIDVVADLPDAGKSYQDHHLLIYLYLSALYENETIDAIVGGRVDVGQLIAENAPILGWNAMDITCKIRPTDAEVAELGAEFRAAWNKDYKNDPNKPLALGSLVSAWLVLCHVFVYWISSLARKHTHQRSRNWGDKPNFTTGFFSDAQGVDIKKHVWAYKKQREIFRRMDTYRGELAMLHPPFPPNSSAALVQLNDNPPRKVTDIVYTPEDDKVIEEFLRKHVETTWHSLGTCRMRPREETQSSACMVKGSRFLT